MWANGDDASSWESRIAEGWPYDGPKKGYSYVSSVRAIASEDEAQGCDAIIRLTVVGIWRDYATFDILSGISQKVLHRSSPDGLLIRGAGIEAFMALQLEPGGESYNAITAEKTADCSAGTPKNTPFCAKVMAQIQTQQASAQRAADADEVRKEATVREKIPAWRALAAKPPLPEGARKYRVLAEDAFGENRFEDAARYYDQALDIQPLWPDGQRNAALLYGELRKYAHAASHMRLYLELVPNAKDAAEARDKIIIWEEKAGHPG